MISTRSKLALALNLLLLLVSAEDQTCKNRTLLETPGDAVLSLFVDVHYGPYCNITSIKGLQELSTALYVVNMLNKYDYVPGISLGIKVFDTCHDEMTVYKQTLQAAVDSECVDQYELGALVPSTYNAVLEPLRNYSIVPISSYSEQNLSKPLIGAMVHYLSTRFEVVDLLLVSTDFALNYFLDGSKEAGICVRSYGDINEVDERNADSLIALIGEREEIREWIETGEKLQGPRKTWVVLPLDGDYVDDLIPPGSYVMKPEPFDFDLTQGFPTVEQLLETASNSVIHSPHLLGIGKTVIELAQVLQEVQKRNCPRGMSCVLPRFNPNSRHEMKNTEVYDALRILPKSHMVKYLVAMKNQQELVDVAVYRVESGKYRVSPEKRVPKMPRLCLKKYANNCEHCVNFQKRIGTRTVRNMQERGLLKSGNWTPIFLTVVVCGTVACGVIAIFIIYRFFAEDMLDGNPSLTLLLILANIFTLQTVLPFCMDDEFVGPESLNARKIFVTTLAFGMDFSVMLSRALFLAFSKGGIFTTHINGYLQGLMVFFMCGVQIAISTMYFILSADDPSEVVRGVTFIALLAYDMFLLVTLFVVCCFVAQLQRNYREGKCFFATAIGLLIAWAVWVTCFILMESESRDIVVCFGIISTGYLIIAGVLIPRTYYMVTHLAGARDLGRKFDSGELGPDPRMNNVARQARPFYDYVHPTIGGSVNNLQVTPAFPNYYGSSSPNQKYFTTRARSPESRRKPAYNNYGFHSEMREVNSSYFTPDICVEDADCGVERSNVDSGYARPKCARKKKLILEEKDCIETDVYVEGSYPTSSRRRHEEAYPPRAASPRVGRTEGPIREENESEDVTRITRF